MVFFNYATMQMAAKIVYYGPGLCGKTTNLQHIYQKTSPKSRGEMVSLETETDRTLFFDLLPLDVGNIAGFKTRFQLYTVPGQVFYNSTRKLVLRGVDGVVFVADSQLPMMEANIESLNNLRNNLAELGMNLDELPLVLQYNKRDLKNVASLEELNQALNRKELPFFEASALQGTGVFETLKGISKATLITLRKRALGDERSRMPQIVTRPMPDRPQAGPSGQTPLASRPQVEPIREPVPPTAPIVNSVPAASPAPSSPANTFPHQAQPANDVPAPTPSPAEIATEKVEFAQVSGVIPARPDVKKIEVKTSDVAAKLDSLRDLYVGSKSGSFKAAKSPEQLPETWMAMLKEEKAAKPVNKKLKIRLEPAELEIIKNLGIDFHLTGDKVHKKFSNAVSVSVEGKSNPKRVILHIELEILKK